MSAKPQAPKPNQELREVAKDMRQAFDHAAGRTRRLTRFTTYQVLMPPSVNQIKGLRAKLKLSQAAFARALNIGARTVQSWEQGLRVPDGCAVVLLWLLLEHQDQVLPWLLDKEA